jgi:hypothetical protein
VADKKKTEGILDSVGKVNIPAILKYLQDLYDVTVQDIPDILNPKPVMSASGCCDHGKCCAQVTCLLTQALIAQLKHQAQCEAECEPASE